MASTPSRRDFVRMAALSAAGAPLLRPLGAQSAPRRARPLGFALVGLGGLSTNQLAPALQKTKNCKLTAIVTGTPAKAAAWKAKYGIPDRSVYSYATMERMADNPDIDVVYVVTPNSLHAEHTIKAAKAGKHVLCEKPMEVTSEKCRQMIAACKAAGRQLAIGYRCRFEPHHLEIERIAREKEMGEVRLIEAGFGIRLGDPTQWRLRRPLAGGGALMDVGVYALQAAEMLAGAYPIAVSAMETKTDPVKFAEVEETMTFELKFPGNIVAACSTSYKFGGVNRAAAFADRGSFGVSPAFNYDNIRAFRSDRKEISYPSIDQFATEMDDFADCIISGKPTRVPGEMGLRDVRTMLAIYEAARTGRTVTLA